MMRKNLNLLTTHYSLQTKSGFSLLEMLFVIGIMAILFLIGTKIFSNSSPKYKVDNAVVIVLNLLNEAKSMTSSAVGSSQYGVHFETTTLTLFKGETFSAVDPNNREIILNENVNLSNISLAGGGADVVFNKLIGTTDHHGTVTISLVSDLSVNEIVTILSTGISY
ncbi:hypothetical protein A2442_01935 [Candidatus Campbellbacteria bacterium RIFOXYC2_FULL_35_25]|uniref:General secretion pathway GspH domain-containing protein n=1 Tax=Candidatus Campbellbacteria bacterium RIFOXYC2_FULL_35_25 TaxID=1797582 RepID=A0A1F5EIU9_9BACT|nr:MAG: hypothetical protein A2442_01935 [Candidatus Campbellbacteria bacterium RIFOXYC2_FULL_35_25]